MTSTEAYDLTLEKIEELMADGIEVSIEPSEFEFCAHETGEIPRDKWINVTFSAGAKEDALIIHEAALELAMYGITFDYDGYIGYREWNLDYSFVYNDDGYDQEWINEKQESEYKIAQ